MTNPFNETESFMASMQQRRRERFKVGVFATLGVMLVLVSALLIQGCKNEQSPAFGSGSLATNENPEPAATAAETTGAPVPLPDQSGGSNPIPPTLEATAPTAAPAEATAAPPTNYSASLTTAPSEPAPAVTQPAPAPKPATPAKSSTTYVVKSGDTLTRIARSHHTTVKAIKSLNKLTTDRIAVGLKLKLPQPAA